MLPVTRITEQQLKIAVTRLKLSRT